MNMRGQAADEMRDPGLNQTKSMVSGVEGGLDDSRSGGDMRMGRGDQMGEMSMGREGNKGQQHMSNDDQGGNPLSKMMGGIGGSKGSKTHDDKPSMGDKLKGTWEQTKGKVTHDAKTTRRGEMRKQSGGGDSADIMEDAGI